MKQHEGNLAPTTDLESLTTTTATAHTEGRIAIDPDDRPGMHWNNHLVFENDPNMTLCFMAHDGTPENENGLANARRLVACWNACEGIGTQYLETTTGLREADIIRKVDVQRERDELIEALRNTFALIEEGYLVRDTSHDDEPGWALKQLEPMRRLAAAAQVLAKV